MEELSGDAIKELDSGDESENGNGVKAMVEGSLNKDDRQKDNRQVKNN